MLRLPCLVMASPSKTQAAKSRASTFGAAPGPAEGLGDRCSTENRAGCADLLRATERIQPLVHLFGHIHQDGGLFQHGHALSHQ